MAPCRVARRNGRRQLRVEHRLLREKSGRDYDSANCCQSLGTPVETSASRGVSYIISVFQSTGHPVESVFEIFLLVLVLLESTTPNVF